MRVLSSNGFAASGTNLIPPLATLSTPCRNSMKKKNTSATPPDQQQPSTTPASTEGAMDTTAERYSPDFKDEADKVVDGVNTSPIGVKHSNEDSENSTTPRTAVVGSFTFASSEVVTGKAGGALIDLTNDASSPSRDLTPQFKLEPSPSHVRAVASLSPRTGIADAPTRPLASQQDVMDEDTAEEKEEEEEEEEKETTAFDRRLMAIASMGERKENTEKKKKKKKKKTTNATEEEEDSKPGLASPSRKHLNFGGGGDDDTNVKKQKPGRSPLRPVGAPNLRTDARAKEKGKDDTKASDSSVRAVASPVASPRKSKHERKQQCPLSVNGGDSSNVQRISHTRSPRVSAGPAGPAVSPKRSRPRGVVVDGAPSQLRCEMKSGTPLSPPKRPRFVEDNSPAQNGNTIAHLSPVHHPTPPSMVAAAAALNETHVAKTGGTTERDPEEKEGFSFDGTTSPGFMRVLRGLRLPVWSPRGDKDAGAVEGSSPRVVVEAHALSATEERPCVVSSSTVAPGTPTRATSPSPFKLSFETWSPRNTARRAAREAAEEESAREIAAREHATATNVREVARRVAAKAVEAEVAKGGKHGGDARSVVSSEASQRHHDDDHRPPWNDRACFQKDDSPSALATAAAAAAAAAASDKNQGPYATPRAALRKAMERLREKEERLMAAIAPPPPPSDGDQEEPMTSSTTSATVSTPSRFVVPPQKSPVIAALSPMVSTLRSAIVSAPTSLDPDAAMFVEKLKVLRLTLWAALTTLLILSSLVLQGVLYAQVSPNDWLALASEALGTPAGGGTDGNDRAAGASLVLATEGILAALHDSPLSWGVLGTTVSAACGAAAIVFVAGPAAGGVAVTLRAGGGEDSGATATTTTTTTTTAVGAAALALGTVGTLAHVAGWVKSAVHYLVTAPRPDTSGFLHNLFVFFGLRHASPPPPPLGTFLKAALNYFGTSTWSSSSTSSGAARTTALGSATRRLFSSSSQALAEEVRAASTRAVADAAAAWRYDPSHATPSSSFGGGGGGGGSWSSEGGCGGNGGGGGGGVVGGRVASTSACARFADSYVASSAGGWRQLAFMLTALAVLSMLYSRVVVGRRRAIAASVASPLVSPGAAVAVALFAAPVR